MEYILSFFLLLLNLIDYQYGINGILFFVAGSILICSLFYVSYRKTKNVICTLIVSMCHTWQISWINIFGDSTEVLQLPWFYVFGALIVFDTILKIKSLQNRQINAIMLGLMATLAVVSLYPLIISPSIKEGLKEFIMIIFFLLLVFCAFLRSDTLSVKHREYILKAYLWIVVISCLFIIFQYFMYYSFGIILFKMKIGVYIGNNMTTAKLLMEDTSCSTIMLGSAAFIMLEKIANSKHKWLYIVSLIVTVIGLALTTRRTSIVSLFFCFALYVLFRYKDVSKKIMLFIFLTAVGGVMLFYLLISRPVDDLSLYLYENGRFANYLSAIKLFIKHPLGVGYDNENIVSLVGSFVPHNTIIRWLNMAGIIFTVLMIIVLGYILNKAYKKKLHAEFWIIFYSVIAMNFIPDILNARYFVIPCMLVLFSIKPDNELLEGRRS